MAQESKPNQKRPLPPVETQWKKGVSGNPRGRPKKKDRLTALLEKEIQKIFPGDKERRTWGELIVRFTLQQAMKGNAAALKEVWDRMEGKVMPQGKLEWNDQDGKQVVIEVVYVNKTVRNNGN